MAKQKTIWNQAEDKLILQNIIGSTNIHASAINVSRIINKPVASILTRYYNVLSKPERRLTRLSERQRFHVEGDPFVTRVVNYYDINNGEHSTIEFAINANLNIIAQEILDTTDIKSYTKSNRRKLEYLLKHKPDLI